MCDDSENNSGSNTEVAGFMMNSTNQLFSGKPLSALLGHELVMKYQRDLNVVVINEFAKILTSRIYTKVLEAAGTK